MLVWWWINIFSRHVAFFIPEYYVVLTEVFFDRQFNVPEDFGNESTSVSIQDCARHRHVGR